MYSLMIAGGMGCRCFDLAWSRDTEYSVSGMYSITKLRYVLLVLSLLFLGPLIALWVIRFFKCVGKGYKKKGAREWSVS